jgi:uncharacterized protein with NRDE domain
MCLALLALDVHERYALVVMANRDEYHERPTAAASWWPEGILAGRDLRSCGTWLGLRRDGRFALLTNVRDPARNDPNAPSRGMLVPLVLQSGDDVVEALSVARHEGARHNGFNLLAGTPASAAWTSNRADSVKRLSSGVYGLSNAFLDVAWPKLVRTRTALARWIDRAARDRDTLFEALADRALAADDELPATGVTRDWERILSAPFIVSERYGTRSSTIVTIDRAGEAVFVERSFDATGRPTGEVVERFGVR